MGKWDNFSAVRPGKTERAPRHAKVKKEAGAVGGGGDSRGGFPRTVKSQSAHALPFNRLSGSFSLALFLSAGCMLTAGRQDGATLAELLLAALAAFLLFPPVAAGLCRLFRWADDTARRETEVRATDASLGTGRIRLRRLCRDAFALLLAVAALVVALASVHEFTDFAANVMFLHMPIAAVAAAFLAFCAYLASCGLRTVEKFAFVAFLFVFLCAVCLFFFSFPQLDRERMIAQSAATLSVSSVFKAFVRIYLPGSVALAFLALSGTQKPRKRSEAPGKVRRGGGEGRRPGIGGDASEKKSGWPCAGAVLYGVTGGTTLLLVCFLHVLLLFGNDFGGRQTYPYAAAVSTITAGKLFFRMEGFAYMMYFSACALRVALCISLLCLLCARVAERYLPKSFFSRSLSFLFGGLLFLGQLFL